MLIGIDRPQEKSMGFQQSPAERSKMTSLEEPKRTNAQPNSRRSSYDAQTIPAFGFVSLQSGFAARRPAPAHHRCLPPGLARQLPRLSRFTLASEPERNCIRRLTLRLDYCGSAV